MPLQSIQELKSFQTLLVRSESKLRNAVDTDLMVNYSNDTMTFADLFNL